MPLYDVILVGFPDGPNIADTPGKAIAQVFGIPEASAEQMAASAPTVVRTNVSEEVARKYFNAFAFIGATCEFRISQPEPEPEQPSPEPARPPQRPRGASLSIRQRPAASVEPTGDFPAVGSRDDVAPTSSPEVPAALSDSGPQPSAGFSELGGSGGWSVVGAPEGDSQFFEMDSEPEVPFDPTLIDAVAADAPEGDNAGPSVAAVRAAWEAGKDITIEPKREERESGSQRSGFDAWDPWMDSGLVEDFPSGVALQEGQAAAEEAADDVDEGTRLEAPQHEDLLAALDARKHDESSGTPPQSSQSRVDPPATRTESRSASRGLSGSSLPGGRDPSLGTVSRSASGPNRTPREPSGSDLFGAPLGVSQAAPAVPQRSEPSAPEPQVPAAQPRTHETVEVPKRSAEFVRTGTGAGRPSSDDGS